jgi:geranylgeranyl pyrophosphate synthase
LPEQNNRMDINRTGQIEQLVNAVETVLKSVQELKSSATNKIDLIDISDKLSCLSANATQIATEQHILNSLHS